MQRPRSPSAETEDGDAKRQRLQPISPLLTYQFLWPMMHKYLDDADVLKSLLIACKAMQPLLTNYALKSSVLPNDAIRFTGWHCYLPVNITQIDDVEREDLRAYTSLETISFCDEYNKPLRPGFIPLSVKSVTFGEHFNQPLGQHILPPGLTYLDLNERYNQVIEPHVLPDGLTVLKLSTAFNKPIEPGGLPGSLKAITFPDKFNQPIPPGLLPGSLTEICFGTDSINRLRSAVCLHRLKL